MKIEIAKARRKCSDISCRCSIEKGEVVGTSMTENQYGHKKSSFCKVCAIKGLKIRRDRINKIIRKLIKM